jgi:hypothetical protein
MKETNEQKRDRQYKTKMLAFIVSFFCIIGIIAYLGILNYLT